MRNLNDLFVDWPPLYQCPPLTPEKVERAQSLLRHTLPPAYIQVLQHQNGGMLRYSRYPSSHPTLFAEDYFSCPTLRGLGEPEGIDSLEEGLTLSQRLVRNWGYPANCVVFGDFGHGAYLFDYANCSSDDAPSIIYADAEMSPTVKIYQVAPDFPTFLSGLYDAGDTTLPSVENEQESESADPILAQADARDEDGRIPLMRAVAEQDEDIARLLLDAGADANARDNAGWTPLMFAAMSHLTDCALLLIDRGADVHARNDKGQTALDVARTNSAYQNVARTLMSAAWKR